MRAIQCHDSAAGRYGGRPDWIRLTVGGLQIIFGMVLTAVVSADKLEVCESRAVHRLQLCLSNSDTADKPGCWFTSQSEYHQCRQQQHQQYQQQKHQQQHPQQQTTDRVEKRAAGGTSTAVPITEVEPTNEPVKAQSNRPQHYQHIEQDQKYEQDKLREVRTIRDIM